jgi:hypothetical protein
VVLLRRYGKVDKEEGRGGGVVRNDTKASGFVVVLGKDICLIVQLRDVVASIANIETALLFQLAT